MFDEFDEKAIARFWPLIDMSAGADGCWFPKSRATWNRASKWYRYPSSFSANGKTYIMHKVAYILAYGSVPDGKDLRHRCGYGCCCNPAHLLPGTAQQNQWDRYAREWAGIGLGQLATYEDIPGYVPAKGW